MTELKNEKKIAFIACVNNEIYFEECRHYIEKLHIPKGYEVEILAVSDAVSMCAGYNEAMQSSDAKYKIYMHQDVFIKDTEFLDKIIQIFKEDSEIGMIGMVGGVQMPKTGVIYRAWNIGKVDCREPDLSYYLEGDTKKKQNEVVEAIDGLIMITQYDIPWREDLFVKFDFYDASGAFEMRRKGYKVVVPYQETPWVIHDSSFAKLNNYDVNRKICLKEYPEFLYAENGYEFSYNDEWDKLSKALAEEIKQMLGSGNFREAVATIEAYKKTGRKDSELELLAVMCDIIRLEEQFQAKKRFFCGISGYQDIYKKYITVRFLLRRMELGFPQEEYGELERAIKKNEISYEAITTIMLHSTIDKVHVLKELERYYEESAQIENAQKIRQIYNKIKTADLPVVYMRKIDAR
ncbi:MAG: glycosyltransferase family protein [Roseburia sp.]